MPRIPEIDMIRLVGSFESVCLMIVVKFAEGQNQVADAPDGDLSSGAGSQNRTEDTWIFSPLL